MRTADCAAYDDIVEVEPNTTFNHQFRGLRITNNGVVSAIVVIPIRYSRVNNLNDILGSIVHIRLLCSKHCCI